MPISNKEYTDLVEFILSAVESEQDEPADFSIETEKRLTLVFSKLNRVLGLPEDYSPK